MSTESHSRTLNIVSGTAEGMYYGLVVGALIFSVSILTGGLGLAAMIGISVSVAVVGGVLGGVKGYLDNKESREDVRENQELLTRIADNLDVMIENRRHTLTDSHSLIMGQLILQADVVSQDNCPEQTIILSQEPAREAGGQLPDNETVFLPEETNHFTCRGMH